MQTYPIQEVNGTKHQNLNIAVVGAGLVSCQVGEKVIFT